MKTATTQCLKITPFSMNEDACDLHLIGPDSGPTRENDSSAGVRLLVGFQNPDRLDQRAQCASWRFAVNPIPVLRLVRFAAADVRLQDGGSRRIHFVRARVRPSTAAHVRSRSWARSVYA
jgi:hypothetical protein